MSKRTALAVRHFVRHAARLVAGIGAIAITTALVASLYTMPQATTLAPVLA